MTLFQYLLECLLETFSFQDKKLEKEKEAECIKINNEKYKRENPLWVYWYSYDRDTLWKRWCSEYIYAGDEIVGCYQSFVPASKEEMLLFEQGLLPRSNHWRYV